MMSLVSGIFIIYLMVVVVLYYLVPKRFQWIVLLTASVLFYAFAGIQYLPFVFGTSIISYTTGRVIGRKYAGAEMKTKIEQLAAKRFCKRILSVAIIIILGALFYSKFMGSVLELLRQIWGSNSVNTIQILFPLGISYYTFSSIGYMLDVYWKRYPEETNYGRYLLYILYFPHILQGPIPRYNRLGAELKKEHGFEYKRITYGVQLMVWGYFQKLVIAERLGIFVRAVYGDWERQQGFVLLVATVFASFQMYTDFAGCMNIVQGVSEIFGISLEKNFAQPYFAKSIEEFWRRWHITLGAWFKDYLCMPIAVAGFTKKLSKKARKRWGITAGKKVATILPLIFVWIATGLWHGTGWNYLFWGCWHGGIIIVSILMSDIYVKWKHFLHIEDNSGYWKAFCILRTFALTAIIPRVITQSATISDAIGVFKRMFSRFNVWVFFDGTLYNYGLDRKNFTMAIFSLAILFIVSLLKEKGIQIREKIAAQPLVFRWIFYYLAFFSVVLFGVYGVGYDASSFVYMNF